MKHLFPLLLACCFSMAMPAGAQDRFVGGDISLLPSYEANGAKYYDQNGAAISDVLGFFNDQGMNAMRVRLFVDPSQATSEEKGQGVCQNLEYVKALGKKIKDHGMKFMLDFHYSDTWADPVKQWTPASWLSLSDDQLYEQISNYTTDALQQLTAAGATPDFIQIGNEISYGMLWGARGTSNYKCYTNSEANWPRFTTLLKKASAACRATCPDAKVIVHVERVANPTVLSAFFDKMASYGVDYDIIGLSYYPYYHGGLSQLQTALNKLEGRFTDKDIMIVETAYYHDWQPSGVEYDISSTYPITAAGQKAFIEALISQLESHPQVKGLFWWWMEANEYGLDWNTKRVTDNWCNYSLFDNQTGKAEPALYVLKDFLGTSGIDHVNAVQPSKAHGVYTLDGRRVDDSPLPKGVYIKNGKKVVRK